MATEQVNSEQAYSQNSRFSAECQRLVRHARDGVRRLTLKRHPALAIDDTIVCLDTRGKRLIAGRKDCTAEILSRLEEAPGHRWVYTNPPTHFSYFSFVVANGCNLHCDYCFAGVGLKNHTMLPELARQMARQVPDLSTPHHYPRVYFFGGEPTLNVPAIASITDELDELGVDYIPKLLTNGLFGEETFKFIVDRHMIVQFSYDGATEDLRMLDKQRTALRRNIRACAKEGLPIIIRPTVSSLNAGNLRELLDDVCDLTGKSLLSINFGLLNPNKGEATNLGDAYRPDSAVFRRGFSAMLERARELGVRISSPHMTDLRTTSDSKYYQPCFISTDGLMSIAACYGADHPESRNLIFGRFEAPLGRFVIDNDVLYRFEENYMGNAFLCDDQACYAQALCGGIKKAVKFCREIHGPEHLDFFSKDIECESMRDMTEIYIIDFLKVFAGQSTSSASRSNGVWEVGVKSLADEVY